MSLRDLDPRSIEDTPLFWNSIRPTIIGSNLLNDLTFLHRCFRSISAFLNWKIISEIHHFVRQARKSASLRSDYVSEHSWLRTDKISLFWSLLHVMYNNNCTSPPWQKTFKRHNEVDVCIVEITDWVPLHRTNHKYLFSLLMSLYCFMYNTILIASNVKKNLHCNKQKWHAT